MRFVCISVLVGAIAVLAGCPSDNYPTDVGTNMQDVERIRTDTSLTPQQQRDQLAALGFDSDTINALLSITRLANQGGGTLRTAYVKITGGQLNALTPDEVQYYGDAVSAFDPNGVFNTTLTDAQAQAIVTLFQQNNLRTTADLSNWLANANNVVPATIPANTLKPLFIDFDPKQLLPQLP